MNKTLPRNILILVGSILLTTSCGDRATSGNSQGKTFQTFGENAFQTLAEKEHQAVNKEAPASSKTTLDMSLIEASLDTILIEVTPTTSEEKEALLAALKKSSSRKQSVPAQIPDKLKIKQEPKNPDSFVAKLKTKASKILNIDLWAKSYKITGLGLCNNAIAAAIINDRIVLQGENITDNIVLKEVTITYATILHEGTEYMLRPVTIQERLNKKGIWR